VGINLSNRDWFEVVHANKLEDKKRVRDGLAARYPSPETFHGYNNIHSTPQGDKVIASRYLKRDNKGKLIPSTARGRRRKARRKEQEANYGEQHPTPEE
jgi:hypothetical protein